MFSMLTVLNPETLSFEFDTHITKRVNELRKLVDVRAIVIHSTAASGQRASVTASYFDRANANAHFVVEPGHVVQCVPLDCEAWHAGKPYPDFGSEARRLSLLPNPNRFTIGIELAETQAGLVAEETWVTCTDLLAVLPQLPILTHREVCGKNCPHAYADEVVRFNLTRRCL